MSEWKFLVLGSITSSLTRPSTSLGKALYSLKDAGRRCCGEALIRYPPWLSHTTRRCSTVMTCAGPCHLPLAPRWFPTVFFQYSTQSPEPYSTLPGLLLRNKALLQALSLSAWMKARRACSRLWRLFLNWIPSGVSLSARAWALVLSSDVSDAGKLRDFPSKACSGVKPLARDNEFFAAKAWRKQRWKSLRFWIGSSLSIRVSMSLMIFPWISALPICQWLSPAAMVTLIFSLWRCWFHNGLIYSPAGSKYRVLHGPAHISQAFSKVVICSSVVLPLTIPTWNNVPSSIKCMKWYVSPVPDFQ